MNTTITQSGLKAIIDSKGAELISLQNSRREYIWEGNPQFWAKHSPVLFPIVGALKNNAYIYDGQTYNLPRHGFAREREFELISQTENQAVFLLKNDAKTLHEYPFRFELQISYTIIENQLKIAYTVINDNPFIMPFSIGAHPAFALKGDFESYALQFSDDDKLVSSVLDDNLISKSTITLKLENKILPLSYSLFENDALILKELNSSKVSILENGNAMLRIHFQDFPDFGIWTKPNAPFLCLEPWFGYADSQRASGHILQKEGIQLLEAKATFDCHFIIEIL